MQRYSRQTVLPEIGEEGQKKISSASVLCVGAGGLGSPALLYLASAGIGHIGIIDFDTVDISNLQRQVIFKTADAGSSKAQKAKEHLANINPEITITAYGEPLTDKNAEELFSQYDIIIDGTDNFSAKFLINDAAVKLKKPLIYGAIQGFDGQVSVFDARKGPCYRCLYPKPPASHIQNCAEAGVIGAIAGIIGTTQALQAIELIVEHESFEPLIGKLWTVNSKTMETKTFKINKNSACPICSLKAEDIKLEYEAPLCTSNIPEITLDETKNIDNSFWLDVRNKAELDSLGKIPKSQHLSLPDIIAGKTPDISTEQNIIVYCQKGGRSKQATQILINKGFKNAVSLIGGYEAWQKNN